MYVLNTNQKQETRNYFSWDFGVLIQKIHKNCIFHTFDRY